jgi:hypothetical protein
VSWPPVATRPAPFKPLSLLLQHQVAGLLLNAAPAQLPQVCQFCTLPLYAA